MQQFLVIQTAFIGDVVLATGIIEKIYRSYPNAAIDFLVRKGNEGLLNGHPFLREVLIWNKKQGKIKNLFKLLLTIRKRRYSKVINVQRFATTGFLTAFSKAEETIGFNKNPFSFLFTKKIIHRIGTSGQTLHEIERNNELIAHFTGPGVAGPVLYPSVTDKKNVVQFQQSPYICIAPSSVWFTKQYPAEKWIAFIKKLPAIYNVYLLGAPSDVDLCNEITKAVPNGKVMNLCGQLTFLASAALMKSAIMNYVNDSAPMHFASAVNAPVTAIYCSTLPAFGFGPLSSNSHIVETTQSLPCRPCRLHGRKVCPLGHFDCARLIQEEQLLNTLPNRKT
jgi:heptosyltransferase-2